MRLSAATKDSCMVNQRSFGRRADRQPPLRQAKNTIEVAASTATLSTAPAPPSLEMPAPCPDEELLAWTKARKQSFKIPWRQVWLMASLCFGIASFVLPESLDDNIQWLLYALAAASFCGGFIKRRKADR
jgi:hypothetical protein